MVIDFVDEWPTILRRGGVTRHLQILFTVSLQVSRNTFGHGPLISLQAFIISTSSKVFFDVYRMLESESFPAKVVNDFVSIRISAMIFRG